ncbi:MAG: response regulator transcription factor, partial [Pseudomonadota bacterium]
MTDNSDQKSGSAEQRLQAIRDSYADRLPDKLDQVQKLWEKLHYLNWSDEAFLLLRHLVHNFAGSGRTFGFSSLSEVAARLDACLNDIIEAQRVPDEGEQARITTFVMALQAAALQPDAVDTQEDTKRVAPGAAAKMGKRVFVVDNDRHVARYVAEQLAGLGYSVRTFDRINAAYKGLSEETPDAVLLDVVFPEGGLAGVEAVANIRVLSGTRTPVLFISVRNDITARLRAVRAGGDAYLTKPLDITALQEQLDALLRNKSADLYRILIIDDDLDAANPLALELQKKGFATHIVNYPMNAIHEVTEFSPDAVLMDLNMRECDGMELARVLRQDDDFVGMPIIFLADKVDAETRQRAAAISDDCFPKPVDTELLTATIA